MEGKPQGRKGGPDDDCLEAMRWVIQSMVDGETPGRTAAYNLVRRCVLLPPHGGQWWSAMADQTLRRGMESPERGFGDIDVLLLCQCYGPSGYLLRYRVVEHLTVGPTRFAFFSRCSMYNLRL